MNFLTEFLEIFLLFLANLKEFLEFMLLTRLSNFLVEVAVNVLVAVAEAVNVLVAIVVVVVLSAVWKIDFGISVGDAMYENKEKVEIFHSS